MTKNRGIYKVGDIYYISFAHNGRTVRKSTRQKDAQEALKMLQTVKADIARKEYRLDRKQAPLFELYADYWLSYCSKPVKRSHRRDTAALKHLKGAFTGLKLSDITREHINRYKVERIRQRTTRGTAPAPATVNRELAVLCTMLNTAKSEMKIAHNPASGRGVLFKVDNNVEHILGRTEEARLYTACQEHLPQHIYWIIYSGFQTGMRLSELLGLKWAKVDLDHRLITIDAASSKNGKERNVPINSNLLELMKNIKATTFSSGGHVFTGQQALKSIRTSFAKAKKLAGIDPAFRFHDIRHTVASRLVTENKVDLVTAARILGHSSVKMLERYAHTRREIETAAMESLGATGIRPDTLKLSKG